MTISLKEETRNSNKYKAILNSLFSKYIIISIFIILYIIALLLQSNSLSNKILSWGCILLSLYLIIKSKENLNLVIVYSLIAYFNYSIIISNYINIFYYSYFTSFTGEYVSDLGLKIIYIFTLFLAILMPNKIVSLNSEHNHYIRKKSRNKSIILPLLTIILLYILIFQFKRPVVDGLRGTPSAIYEYSIIFFIIGFHFLGNHRFSRIVLTAILILFILQNFIFGGRIIGLQMILLYFVMFYSHKTEIIKILPVVFTGFIIMSLIGIERANFNISIESFKMVVENIKDKVFALDTAYSAYFTSLTFLKVGELIPVQERVQLFVRFLLSIIFGGRIEDSNLPNYTRSFIMHYGGGIIPFYFYFYLSWLGVFISAVIVNLYIKSITNQFYRNNGLVDCLSVYFVSTTFRWYLYTPLILLRGLVLFVITYFTIHLIYKLRM